MVMDLFRLYCRQTRDAGEVRLLSSALAVVTCTLMPRRLIYRNNKKP